jgi:hypothetical protein
MAASNDNDLGLPARFWAKVQKAANDGGCWEWTGPRNAKGYGRVGGGNSPKRSRGLVHRLVLAAKLGRPIAPEMFACHACDNPPCVNPDHLWEGTAKDNAQDAGRKRRGIVGEWNHHAKLTEDDVRAIRAATGSQQEIANRFGVGRAAVGHIRTRRNWQHVA